MRTTSLVIQNNKIKRSGEKLFMCEFSNINITSQPLKVVIGYIEIKLMPNSFIIKVKMFMCYFLYGNKCRRVK